MNRIVLFSLSLVALIAAGLLIAPSFIDWNRYKPQIVQEVKTATGYDVAIAGDLSLSLIPYPRLRIDGLSVAAPRPGRSETLLSMERASVSVALLPLLGKKVEVSSVTLVRPDITLEVLNDGTQSWMTEKLSAAQEGNSKGSPAAQNGSSAPAVSLDKLQIEDGRLSYANAQTGGEQVLEDVDATLRADTLAGPFKADGTMVYNGQKMSVSADIGRLEEGQPLSVNAEVGLPDANAEGSFAGLATTGENYELQGEASLKADSVRALGAQFGAALPEGYDRELEAKGMVTAGPNAAGLTDLAFKFGDVEGTGKIALENLKDKSPLVVNATLETKGVLDIDALGAAKDAAKDKDNAQQSGASGTVAASASLLPQTLTLPMAVDGRLDLSAEGFKAGGQTFRGVTVNATKTGKSINAALKAQEVPGKGQIDATAQLAYASASVSEKTGAVTYADPDMTFKATGAVEQLPTSLRVAAPEQRDNPALELWKTARFDLSGSVGGRSVTLGQSTLKLDQTTLGVAGSYQPASGAAAPKATVSLSADTIDIDAIKARLDGGQPAATSQTSQGQPVDLEKSLEPVRKFSFPMDLTFDLSARKARVNGMDVSGVRIKGHGVGQKLTLETASADNVLNAAASVSGSVENLEKLTGIDMTFYGKSQDVDALMDRFNLKSDKLPRPVGAGEATVDLKGQADNLAFTANLKALQGQVNATGSLTNLLAKPVVDNLTLAVKHPNFVKAVQIFNPAFKGGAGLERPVDFYTKVVKDGEVYNFSELRGNLGPTALTGSITADMSGSVPSVKGSIQAGTLPLDDFLGATQKPKSTGKAASQVAIQDGTSSRWSRNAIQTGWMRSLDLDLALAAKAITYGGWNFTDPQTSVKLGGGTLNVSGLKAGLFGGSATLDARVQAGATDRDPLSLTVKADMDNVGIEPLAVALSGSNKLKAQGTGALNFDVQSTGISPSALINALNGNASLNASNVTMEGFDLAKLARGLSEDQKIGTSVQNILAGATSGGTTRFDTVKGAYAISEGIVRITDMKMDGPSALISTTGNANLPNWTIDLNNEITLKNVPDMEPFNVAIKGPLDNPGNTFGRSILDDYLDRKIQRKIDKELGGAIQDKLGSEATGALQQLGILPKQQAQPKPQSQTQPQQQQSAPQNQQPASGQEELSPEEKAIQGVLEGLLGN